MILVKVTTLEDGRVRHEAETCRKQAGRVKKLTTSLQLVLRSRKLGSIHPLPQYLHV
jgi:hypothetical protein